MPKKYLTQKQKSARIKKILLITLIAVILISALLIVLGAVLGHRADEEKRAQEEKEKASYEYLRANMEKNYREDPWDGGAVDGVERKEGDLWVAFEALMCIEDDGMRKGSKGVQYDLSAGNVLCVDLMAYPEEELRSAVIKMLKAYCSFKGMTFRTGTLEELKSEGKIDTNGPDVYTEGCLMILGRPAQSKADRSFETRISFYYSNRNGRGAIVKTVPKIDWDQNKKTLYKDAEAVSDDGVWVSYVTQTMIS